MDQRSDDQGWKTKGFQPKEKANTRKRRLGDYVPMQAWMEMNKKEREEVMKARRGRVPNHGHVARSAAPRTSINARGNVAQNSVVKAMNVFTSTKSSYAGVVRGTTTSKGLEQARPFFVDDVEEEWISQLAEDERRLFLTIEEEKAKQSARRAWRVQLKADVLPALSLEVWSKKLRKAKGYVENECNVVEVRPYPNGIELCLDRPVHLDVGTMVAKLEVILSEPLDDTLCVTMWECTDADPAAGGLAYKLIEKLCGEKVVLCERMKGRMVTVSAGPMVPLIGHNALVLKNRPLMNRTPVYAKACRSCHGLGHMIVECASFWKDREVTQWTKGTVYKHKKKAKGAKDAAQTTPSEGAATTRQGDTSNTTPSNASTNENAENTSSATAGSQMPGVENTVDEWKEIESPDEELLRMHAQLKAEEEAGQGFAHSSLMMVINTKARAGYTDGNIRALAEMQMSAAIQLPQKDTCAEAKTIGFWIDEGRRERNIAQVINRIRMEPEEQRLIECGGNGDCGPLSLLGGEIFVGKRDRIPEYPTTEVQKLRDDVTARWAQDKEQRKDDTRFWLVEDFTKAAKVLRLNVMIIEAKMESWQTGITTAMYGGPEDEIIRIFGGDRYGMHWVLMTRNVVDEIEEMWPQVVKKDTLADTWIKLKVDAKQIPRWIQAIEEPKAANNAANTKTKMDGVQEGAQQE